MKRLWDIYDDYARMHPSEFFIFTKSLFSVGTSLGLLLFFSFWKYICIRNFKHIFFIKITSEKTLIGIFFMENICFSNNSKLTVLTVQIDLFNWTKGIYYRMLFSQREHDQWWVIVNMVCHFDKCSIIIIMHDMNS